MASTQQERQLPSITQLLAACEAVAHTLGQTDYAIVGGAACAILGSERLTWDIDLVVPKGATKTARGLLKQQKSHFDVDSRTQHTTYTSTPSVPIEILAPPALFREDFTAATPTVTVRGVRVLKPTLLLNAKCGSLVERATDERKGANAADIRFLLAWCIESGQQPPAGDVRNATPGFVNGFMEMFGGEDLWEKAGYLPSMT